MTLVSKITAVNGQVHPFCGPQHAPAASRPLLDKLRKELNAPAEIAKYQQKITI